MIVRCCNVIYAASAFCTVAPLGRPAVRIDGREGMEVEGLRKKPACVLQRDAWLTELRQLEDRESLRPWLNKYGGFSISIVRQMWIDVTLTVQHLNYQVAPFRVASCSVARGRHLDRDDSISIGEVEIFPTNPGCRRFMFLCSYRWGPPARNSWTAYYVSRI